MHPRMQELLEFMDAQYAAFCAAADAVPAADRERQPAGGGWSVAQVVDHAARVENMVAAGLAKTVAYARAKGVAEETETGTVLSPAIMTRITDRSRKFTAPEPAQAAPDPRYDDARAALEQARGRVREAFIAADGLALGTITMPHPRLGVLTVYEWGTATGGHHARHAEQIREIAASLSPAPPAEAAPAGA